MIGFPRHGHILLPVFLDTVTYNVHVPCPSLTLSHSHLPFFLLPISFPPLSILSSSTVSPLIDLLKTMSPSAIDAEFRSLAPVAGGSTEQLAHFMGFLLDQLRTRMNFELIESYLALFLKVGMPSPSLPPFPQGVPSHSV